MSGRAWRRRVVAVVVVVVVVLPLVGKWLRSGATPRCALDGVPIEPLYRVRVVDGQGAEHLFCCIDCARHWLEQEPPGRRTVFVTDETSGEEIDADSAWFVRSRVVTTPATGNRVHAFRTRADATRHAEAARGKLLRGDDRPFRQEARATAGGGTP
jgi:NosL protein